MVFGSHQRLSKADDISINLNNVTITKTMEYDYLGVKFDSFVNHFSSMYKKYHQESSSLIVSEDISLMLLKIYTK